MTCQQVQVNLSLYLYGELDFAGEEELELHLAECSFCQLALSREKSWHTTLNGERTDVPLDLLSQCRRDLRVALHSDTPSSLRLPWWQKAGLVSLRSSGWSPRLAFASLFLFLGFSVSQWAKHLPLFVSSPIMSSMQAGLTPEFSRIRAVQGGENNRVRIVVDRVQQRAIEGSITDAGIRELLMQGSKDPTDPGLRVDAVELMNGQDGSDIRDALLYSATHDENAAVRLKAVDGLRRFRDDRSTHDTLLQVLEQDASPAVRTEAIDVLAPANLAGPVSPELATTLQGILQSDLADDYLHSRCVQILNSGKRSPLY